MAAMKPGLDYGAEGRDEPKWEATVAEHKGAATLPLPDRTLSALQATWVAGACTKPKRMAAST